MTVPCLARYKFKNVKLMNSHFPVNYFATELLFLGCSNPSAYWVIIEIN